MIKTTVYLPDDLKRALAAASLLQGLSEAEFIREALRQRIGPQPRPKPRLPLVDGGPEDPSVADRADEILRAGFGR